MRRSLSVTSLVWCAGLLGAELWAQAAKNEPKDAVIERAPIVIRDPIGYQTPLHLDPAQQVDVSAVASGVVASLEVKVGAAVKAQSELLRFDAAEVDLLIKRAQAGLKAAEADQELSDAKASEGAKARVEVAKVDLDLAELRRAQLAIKAPFSGVVLKVHVVAGQYVRAGEPLVTLADPSKLVVEVPIDRTTTKAGDSLDVKIEDKTAQVKVDAVLPLNQRFEPLRELFLSVASAYAVIDNSAGRYNMGQTVYSTMIPRHPVIEAPTGSLSNTDDGGRKVQVIRDGLVRDVPIIPLGQMGDERVFISGPFAPRDELVVKTSETLLDGARVVPRGGEPPAGDKPKTGTNRPPMTPGTPAPMPKAPSF